MRSDIISRHFPSSPCTDLLARHARLVRKQATSFFMKRRIVCGIEGQINDAVCFQRRSILGRRGGGVFAEGGENLGGLDKFPLHARARCHRDGGRPPNCHCLALEEGQKGGGRGQDRRRRRRGATADISFGAERANR